MQAWGGARFGLERRRGLTACRRREGAGGAPRRAGARGASGKGAGLQAGDAAPQLLAILLAWNVLGGLLAAWALGPSAVGAAALDAAREQWRQTREALGAWFDGSRAAFANFTRWASGVTPVRACQFKMVLHPPSPIKSS